MKRSLKKLHSERGASILLGLLILLVCVMVSASVLAAAAANAGKARSGRVEHQKYLTLSSAIRLVADELETVAYTGRYRVTEWEVKTTRKDAATGEVLSVSMEYFFCCEQTGGVYAGGELETQLPLKKELEEIFRRQFTAKGDGYKGLEGDAVENSPSVPRALLITLPDNLGGYPYEGTGPAAYQAPKEVTVQVKLDHETRHITLKAWLGTEDAPPADGSDTLIAELVSVVTDPDDPTKMKAGNLTIDYDPAGKEPVPDITDPPASSGPATADGVTTEVAVDRIEKPAGTAETPVGGTPMKWELNWIRKGVS